MTPAEILDACRGHTQVDIDGLVRDFAEGTQTTPKRGVCRACAEQACVAAVDAERLALHAALNEFRAKRGEERSELKYAFNTVDNWLFDRTRGAK